MTTKRWKYHTSALKHLATMEASLERLKDNATSETDRTILDAAVKCTEPVEMQNDHKERYHYATTAAILMCWILIPDAPPIEGDRFVMDGIDHRIRKVKAWPKVSTPAFYELHIEDEA